MFGGDKTNKTNAIELLHDKTISELDQPVGL